MVSSPLGGPRHAHQGSQSRLLASFAGRESTGFDLPISSEAMSLAAGDCWPQPGWPANR